MLIGEKLKLLDLVTQKGIIFQKGSDSTALVFENRSLEKTIAFKIKTTSPNHYLVKPNIGKIDPGKRAIVEIILKRELIINLEIAAKDMFLILASELNYEQQNMDMKFFWNQFGEKSGQSEQMKLSVEIDPQQTPFRWLKNTISNATVGLVRFVDVVEELQLQLQLSNDNAPQQEQQQTPSEKPLHVADKESIANYQTCLLDTLDKAEQQKQQLLKSTEQRNKYNSEYVKILQKVRETKNNKQFNVFQIIIVIIIAIILGRFFYKPK